MGAHHKQTISQWRVGFSRWRGCRHRAFLDGKNGNLFSASGANFRCLRGGGRRRGNGFGMMVRELLFVTDFSVACFDFLVHGVWLQRERTKDERRHKHAKALCISSSDFGEAHLAFYVFAVQLFCLDFLVKRHCLAYPVFMCT